MVLMIVTMIVTVAVGVLGKTDPTDDILGALMAGMGDGGGDVSDSDSDDSSASELDSRELKKYFKEIEKQERKIFKSIAKEKILQHEKDQVKYFDNILEKVKLLNKKMRRNLPITQFVHA